MSVQPRPWPEFPEQTAAVARAAFPKEALAMWVREELPGLFADEQLVSAFGVRGKPGISPGQLALVTVLQFAENLTDRQAADAVRGRIDWKYALGLELSLSFNLFWLRWWTWWCFSRRRAGGRAGGSWSRVGVLARVVRVLVRWRGEWFSAGGCETRGGCGWG
jgi:hypothetical protein